MKTLLSELDQMFSAQGVFQAALGSLKRVVNEKIGEPWIRSRLRCYRPHVRLYCQAGSYVVKTAESSWELESALELRRRVFYGELQGKGADHRFDVDRFDFQCDHLIVLDPVTRRVVGTYRLISSAFSKQFYSSTEFDLTHLLKRPGIKLELGRACIDPEYRTGYVIALLWKGIMAYLEQLGAETIFGCSSVQTTKHQDVVDVIVQLEEKGVLMKDLEICPHQKYQMALSVHPRPSVERFAVPSLIMSYVKMGAKIAAYPAFDRAFQCVDFLTVLEKKNLSGCFERRLTKPFCA